MKIALMGYGKMGKLVEAAALKKGHAVVVVKDCTSIGEVDICVDFSHPSAALNNIKRAAGLGINIVVGTTGWYDHLPEVQRLVKDHEIGLLYAPNFSIGVALFLKIVEQAARIMDTVDDYDVSGLEAHHKQKADAPSGTAKLLAKTLCGQMQNKKRDEIPFSSVRCGHIPGTHTILFDSHCDTITLTHSARNREGFAEGALVAAEWLYRHNQPGLYTLDDVLAKR